MTDKTTKGGRPKLADHERRDHLLQTRCNDLERAAIQERAASVGLSESEFMRVAALKCKIEVTQGRLTRDFMVEVSRIGNNLNQLTHRAHLDRLGPFYADQLAHALDDVRAVLRKGFGLDR